MIRHRRIQRKAGQAAARAELRWVTDRGVRVATGRATLACYRALSALALPEIEDVIPADGSLLVVLRAGAALPEAVWGALSAPQDATIEEPGALHEIAVAYGGAGGPDLADVAARAGLSAAGYIARHAAVEYSVAFLGFQPGFPYLEGLPPALHAPRRTSPRVRVPVGSVAVGGAYAGIYPAEGPGGWNLIGRCETVLFDPSREAPALLLPGDRVRFVPR